MLLRKRHPALLSFGPVGLFEGVRFVALVRLGSGLPTAFKPCARELAAMSCLLPMAIPARAGVVLVEVLATACAVAFRRYRSQDRAQGLPRPRVGSYTEMPLATKSEAGLELVGRGGGGRESRGDVHKRCLGLSVFAWRRHGRRRAVFTLMGANACRVSTGFAVL